MALVNLSCLITKTSLIRFKNIKMKKIILLLTIGFGYFAHSQTIDIYYEKNTDLKFVGDTITFWIDANKAIINSCIARSNGQDITNTFFFDYIDSKGKSHYKQVALMFPDRGIYCRTNVGQFQGNPSYQGLPNGIDDIELFFVNGNNKTYYTIHGIKIDNPDIYIGVMICEGKVIIKY